MSPASSCFRHADLASLVLGSRAGDAIQVSPLRKGKQNQSETKTVPVGNVIPPLSCTCVSSEDSQPLCLPEGFSQQEDRLGLVSSGNTRPLPLLLLLLLRSVSLPIYSQTHGAVILKITALCASAALHRSLPVGRHRPFDQVTCRSVQNLKVQWTTVDDTSASRSVGVALTLASLFHLAG